MESEKRLGSRCKILFLSFSLVFMLSAFFRGWVEVVEDYSTTEKKENQKQPYKRTCRSSF